MQRPTEFVRDQVTAVRESVATAAAEASTVNTTVSSSVGEFIRNQRNAAQVSLRELSRLAGVSNPYLSQVERGLRKPSAEILAQIARGLKISAETLYEQAGILDRRSGTASTVAALRADEALSERHKAVLLELYETYTREHAAQLAREQAAVSSAPAPTTAPTPTPQEEPA
ncbi:helix-turn-helix transcriptional regulator [Modestobacter sp. VKM Ac-2983]|uniref:helix-turn-helix domain-containing protein n=1 Tax=Modestobacter sp. VKM Ac-2983 TaxID=3004137 RepID=UPI0022AB7780|nr:helix-turn-helix transcriptional regulator [Modestobacter sp. VKM Ac-2983]MCZ2806217.1 helix-turn-helix transcriptional regulator [Modestobacter sp. VKM Ac-2983]